MEQHAFERSPAERMAVGLGWFSIALGVAEMTAPRQLARLIGIRDDDRTASVLRALGAREIGHGLAILSNPGSSLAVWSRVGGDALDISLLGKSAADDDAPAGRTAAATAALLGVAAADILCAVQLGRESSATKWANVIEVEHAVTINRPIEEVFAFWLNLENFPRFMQHLESVEVLGNGVSRWRARAPAGMTVQWEAEVVEVCENELIAWQSIEGSGIQNSGVVRFEHAPGARGTEVHVQLHYHPPAGDVGRVIARLFGEEPEQQLRDDLRRLRQVIETGEIAISDGVGLRRPAQPPADPAEVRRLVGVEQ